MEMMLPCMNKPLIAIVARTDLRENIKWIVNPQPYFEAILQAGGIPVLIYHTEVLDDPEIAMKFDGLMIPGGDDVNADKYNHDTCSSGKNVDPIIDELDIRMIHAFNRQQKPILGICRGMQCLNVAFGGTLIQDIGSAFGVIQQNLHDPRKITPVLSYEGVTSHEITCVPNSQIYACFGEHYLVNSYHHQCIDQVADLFHVSSYCGEIIESIEYQKMIGVQWHPEWLNDKKSQKLFHRFVQLSASHEEMYFF